MYVQQFIFLRCRYDSLSRKTSSTHITEKTAERANTSSRGSKVSLSVNDTGSIDRRGRSTAIDEPYIPEKRPPSRKSPAPQPEYNSMDRKSTRQPAASHNKSFDVSDVRHRNSSQSSDVFLPSHPNKMLAIHQVGACSSAVDHLSVSSQGLLQYTWGKKN